ncbi:hypothetical protein KM043_018712 [Ampulex compressa]|nr:hypothetical protein KM043_018712 [Ampulex compressa]
MIFISRSAIQGCNTGLFSIAKIINEKATTTARRCARTRGDDPVGRNLEGSTNNRFFNARREDDQRGGTLRCGEENAPRSRLYSYGFNRQSARTRAGG